MQWFTMYVCTLCTHVIYACLYTFQDICRIGRYIKDWILITKRAPGHCPDHYQTDLNLSGQIRTRLIKTHKYNSLIGPTLSQVQLLARYNSWLGTTLGQIQLLARYDILLDSCKPSPHGKGKQCRAVSCVPPVARQSAINPLIQPLVNINHCQVKYMVNQWLDLPINSVEIG